MIRTACVFQMLARKSVCFRDSHRSCDAGSGDAEEAERHSDAVQAHVSRLQSAAQGQRDRCVRGQVLDRRASTPSRFVTNHIVLIRDVNAWKQCG